MANPKPSDVEQENRKWSRGDIWYLWSEGYNKNQIALRVGCSPSTVRRHLQKLNLE